MKNNIENKNFICTTCQETGKVECKDCLGAGGSCKKCGGSGKENCKNCKGSGRIGGEFPDMTFEV